MTRKAITILGVLAASLAMTACSSTQTCSDKSAMACCGGACGGEGEDCCGTCGGDAKGHAHNHNHKGDSCGTECADGKAACSGDCSGEAKGDCCGSCATDKQANACTHPNAMIDCPMCKKGKPCCAECAKKMAAACPDC